MKRIVGFNDPFLVYKKYIKPCVSIDIFPDYTIHKNNDEDEGILKEEDIQDLIQAGLVEKIEGETNK